jgi:hypothetical protein
VEAVMRLTAKWQWHDDGNAAETQWRCVFAWLPTKIGNEWFWLEPYETKLRAWGWGFVDAIKRPLDKEPTP